MSTKRLAIIGDPVSGSLSPVIHRAALAALGLDLEYVPVQVSRARLLELFPRLHEEFLGLNVTRPLKELAAGLCDELSTEASRAGSVNTIVFDGDLARGSSTDVKAFMPAVRKVTARPIALAVILGTGGAARAAALALVNEGANVHVTGRNKAAGNRLSSQLGVNFSTPTATATRTAIQRMDLLVNATPVGGSEEMDASPLPERTIFPRTAVVFDLVYRPRTTRLLESARAQGCEVVEGLCLLVEQGALSLEMWTGLQAPRDVMLAAAVRALDDQHQGALHDSLQPEEV